IPGGAFQAYPEGVRLPVLPMYPHGGADVRQTQLSNGTTVWFDVDAHGRLIMQYPDGSQVQTTWKQVGMMEQVVQMLRELYEELLLRASTGLEGPALCVDKLAELDDLLFALTTANRAN
nr:hypothetical protein [Phycisphaerae bacterium]